jgi:predicted transcriptional regulator
MKNSLHQLTKISETVNSHQTYYKFNKMDEHLTEKYRKGRVNAAKWLNELIWFYINKESQFIVEFKEQIQEQKKNLADLEDGDFKQGLFDELNLIEDIVNGRINKSK